jgi:Family of unknown function (DUF6272)
MHLLNERNIMDVDQSAENNAFFYYSGYFSQSLIEAAADAIRMRLEASGQSNKIQRRIISAFIEMGQNIVHYSAESLTNPDADTDEVRFGKIRIMDGAGEFTLMCANPVPDSAAKRLNEKLEVLSSMSMDEIRENYRAALRASSGEEGSKGGGLGFLTLARESKDPLKFSFDEIADKPRFKMFNLIMTV